MGNARSVIKQLRFPLDIMLLCVRWYVAYPLSLRNLEEMMQERGVFVDHSTIYRWLIKLVPVLGEAFRKRRRKRGIGAVGKAGDWTRRTSRSAARPVLVSRG
jgi:transposase-like protein